ncbi:MAG: glycosyltransferase family A protein [Alphaproteobacteria bacterium]
MTIASGAWWSQYQTVPLTAAHFQILVFMPTYAPTAVVRSGLRDYRARPYTDLLLRSRQRDYSVPWTYLDAIDSIFHTLSTQAHLVVADFRSSAPVRDELLRHQGWYGSNAPNYELWLGDEKDSQWRVFNAVLKEKLPQHRYDFIVYTSSDVIWTQRGWLTHCINAMRQDWDCWITWPTVTRASADVPWQKASGAVDKEPFEASLCNAYVAVFRREFFEAYGGRYPDVFRNAYTEAFQHYMLKAMGKRQLVIPRANLSHCEALDTEFRDDPSVYEREQPIYDSAMKEIREWLTTNDMGVNLRPILLRNLYREPSYYDGLAFTRCRQGQKVEDVVWEKAP